MTSIICPYNKKLNKLCTEEKCDVCFNKSFASHDNAKYWSPKNMGTPRQNFKYARSIIIFDCPTCLHEFKKALCSFSTHKSKINKTTGCPYCCNTGSIICKDMSCIKCTENSFLYHPKVKYWSIKNTYKPRDLPKGTDIKIIFNCDACPHEFEAKLYTVANYRGWCPYCHNSKLCDNNDCKTCFDKSFASNFDLQFGQS